jgi:hypothetical protein
VHGPIADDANRRIPMALKIDQTASVDALGTVPLGIWMSRPVIPDMLSMPVLNKNVLAPVVVSTVNRRQETCDVLLKVAQTMGR